MPTILSPGTGLQHCAVLPFAPMGSPIKDIESIGGSVRLIEGNTLTLVNINENRMRSRL